MLHTALVVAFAVLSPTVCGFWASMVTGESDNAFNGHPPKHRGVRWVSYEEKLEQHRKAGYTWPQRRKFKGWPPVPDGEHSEEYIKTRLQIEGEYRRIPLDVHHRLDDFEARGVDFCEPSPNLVTMRVSC